MRIISTIAANYSIVILFMFIFSMPALLFPKKNNAKDLILEKILISIFAALNIIMQLMFFSAQKEISISGTANKLFWLMLGLAITSVALNSRGVLSIFKIEAKYLAMSLVPIFPVLLLAARSGLVYPFSSSMNNDIASYAGTAEAFGETGWVNTQTISSFNLNEFAQISSPFGTTSLLAFFSKVLSLKSFETTTATMAIAIVINLLCGAQLYRSMHRDRFTNFLVPTLVIAFFCPIMTYVIANYFLGQIFSLGICLLFLSAVIELSRNTKTKQIYRIQIILSVSNGIYLYPVFTIPFFLFVLLTISVYQIYKKEFDIKTILQPYLGMLLGVIISVTYLLTAIKILNSQANATAGWKLPSLNMIAILLFPELIGLEFSSLAVLTTWIFFFTLLTLLFFRLKHQNNLVIGYLSFVALPIFLCTAFMIYSKNGIADYKIWKLITFLLPIMLLYLVPLVASYAKYGFVLVTIIATLAASSPMTTWAINAKSDAIMTKDMENLQHLKELKPYRELNIKLGNYFESMAMASMLNDKILFINNYTYWPRTYKNEACTIMRYDQVTNEKILKILNQTYVLVTVPNIECKLT